MTNTIKLLAVASVFLASSAFAANPPAAPEPEAQPTVKAAPADLQAPAPVADVQDPALKLPVDLTPADKAQTADEPQPQDGKQAPQPEKAAQPDKAGKAKETQVKPTIPERAARRIRRCRVKARRRHI